MTMHVIATGIVGVAIIGTAYAQLSDQTQTPNLAEAGIAISLDQQAGAGRGDLHTPDSSIFLINRDPFRAIMRGRQLFQRKFTLDQGFGPRVGDGVGDIEQDAALGAGLADSCSGCHGRPRGSAGFGGEVFTRPDSRDAPHLFGLGLQEMIADEMTSRLRGIRDRAVRRAARKGKPVKRKLRAKGVGFGEIIAYPDGFVDTSGVEGVDENLRVKPFFADGSEWTIRGFIVGALQNEMGLQAYDPDLAMAAAGAVVTTPTGMVLDGTQDTFQPPPVAGSDEDGDHDGVSGEVDPALVDYLEVYLLNYFKPATYRQTKETREGRRLLRSFGCTDCHKPRMRIRRDRRVADVETSWSPDALDGDFNSLYAVARPLIDVVSNEGDSDLGALRVAKQQSTVVRAIYSDFKRHDLGPNFWERNFDGSLRKEFVTEPLWGVASTGPYGHDGRSINLNEVILRHGGEALASRDAYMDAPAEDRDAIIAFLQTLILFPPPDTASNLDPGDPDHPDYPQRGHGSIDLRVLFNDPLLPE